MVLKFGFSGFVGGGKMQEVQITDKEYDKLIKRIEFFDAMRNNLLTFSFTSVLTVLGVALAIDMDSISAWICLMPFLLILPFTARISYYRLASAHINSFLRKFGQKDMQFELGANVVNDGKCTCYDLIAWLVNHEMVLLSIATSGIFYFKYIILIKEWKLGNYISLLIPLILICFDFIIANSTYNFKKLLDRFSAEWDKYADS